MEEVIKLYAVAVTSLCDNETVIEFHRALSKVEALSMHSYIKDNFVIDTEEDLEYHLQQLFNSDLVAGVEEVPSE